MEDLVSIHFHCTCAGEILLGPSQNNAHSFHQVVFRFQTGGFSFSYGSLSLREHVGLCMVTEIW